MLHIAKEEEILRGKVTDVYFLRAKEILEKKKLHRRVKAEFVVKKFPHQWPYGVLAGVEEACRLLARLPVTVWAMPEGTVFRTGEPVIILEGDYLSFLQFETALLGFLCQASGIATKASRLRQLSGDRMLFSFGSRRMHPALAPMVERSAYLGGCDGVSSAKGASFIGIAPVGTMPHSLILLLGSSEEAIRAFHEVIDKKVKRICLVDTLSDEKFEAIRAAEVLGKNLFGVRLDTPSSRRGNFVEILKEVRWELDLRGHSHVKIFVSGGLDEEDLPKLNPWVYGYGIGTALSCASSIDFAMDIVEVEGEPFAKRGKLSGAKSVLRCHRCYASLVVPLTQTSRYRHCHCGGKREELLERVIDRKRVKHPFPKVDRIRKYVLEQIPHYALAP
ncbi:MAG: nicotinate phosphoribosyltransferase [Candidatus Omnitrophica bacterium]|nr:nicotinate phosphoribosyltransferase [Candidatus Omnitrophota bacterium]